MLGALFMAAAAVVNPTPADDPVDRVVAILARGEAGVATRQKNVVRDAVLALEAIGARPVGDDAAQRWRAFLGGKAPPPQRGRGLGPGYRMGTLASGEVLKLEQIFLAGERADIAAQTLGNGTLRLQIASLDGRSTCTPPEGLRMRCRWIPVFTQRFAIRLTNASASPMPYYLAVN